jgi:hypothetical protein
MPLSLIANGHTNFVKDESPYMQCLTVTELPRLRGVLTIG